MKSNCKVKFSGYITLISVLIAGAVSLSVAISLILLGLGSSRTSFSKEQSGQAKSLANACAEEGLQKIRDATSYEGSGSLILGPGTCNYTVTIQSGQNRTVTATGTVKSVIKKVRVTLDTISPQIHLTSWLEVANF
ncbi:MAG TPA: hypothetical protein VJJ80_01240 [Patescibacteria group bacterium]|nr:hypothetical protein [Patescibacteria group bacterium]